MSEDRGRVPGSAEADATPVSPDPADYFYAWYALRYGKAPLTGARLSLDLFTAFLSDHLRSGCSTPSIEDLLATLPVVWVGLKDFPKAKEITAKAFRRARLLNDWERRTGCEPSASAFQPKLFDES